MKYLWNIFECNQTKIWKKIIKWYDITWYDIITTLENVSKTW